MADGWKERVAGHLRSWSEGENETLAEGLLWPVVDEMAGEIARLEGLVAALESRVAALEATNDRRESYEQEQNEQG